MTHNSSHLYMQRGIEYFIAMVWIIHRVWRVDKFAVFRWENIRKLRTHTVATILLLLSLLLDTLYNLIIMFVKYDEGMACEFGEETGDWYSITKPKSLYDPEHIKIIDRMDLMLNFSMTFESSGRFLLLASWGWILRGALRGKSHISFMSSREFKAYVIWSLASIVVYPILTFSFSHDSLLRVIAPQFLFILENLMTVVACQTMRWKFAGFLKGMAGFNTTSVRRIQYYVHMNDVWTFTQFLMTATHMIANVDTAVFISTQKITSLYASDLGSDLLWTVFSLAQVATFVVNFRILYVSPEHYPAANHSSGNTVASHGTVPSGSNMSNLSAATKTHPKKTSNLSTLSQRTVGAIELQATDPNGNVGNMRGHRKQMNRSVNLVVTPSPNPPSPVKEEQMSFMGDDSPLSSSYVVSQSPLANQEKEGEPFGGRVGGGGGVDDSKEKDHLHPNDVVLHPNNTLPRSLRRDKPSPLDEQDSRSDGRHGV